jgi:hypothetical protein
MITDKLFICFHRKNLIHYTYIHTHIHTYKLYLFTLASTTFQADFHGGRDLELFTG